MDLALYGRVLSRFRLLVGAGFALAIILTVLSVARITWHGLEYRSNEVWQSTSTLLLTRNGNPFAEPGRYSELTDLYSQLANSDSVRSTMLRAGADERWNLTAAPVQPTSNPTAVLPVISVTGEAFSPTDAIKATSLGRQAFLEYISQQQGAAGIQVLQKATLPTLTVPRKKTLPIVVFLAMISSTIAAAFVLENLRPRTGPVEVIKPKPGIISSATGTHSSA